MVKAESLRERYRIEKEWFAISGLAFGPQARQRASLGYPAERPAYTVSPSINHKDTD